jgi:hypothetical protein
MRARPVIVAAMSSRAGAVAGALALLLAGAIAAPASAAPPPSVGLYETSEEATLIGKVTRANCRTRRFGSGRSFLAKGKTTNGNYKLEVFFSSFGGFGDEYNVSYTSLNPTVDVEGIFDGNDYSTAYPIPGGEPPESAGRVLFNESGRRMGVGIFALPNQDWTEGLAVAGSLRCRYPR